MADTPYVFISYAHLNRGDVLPAIKAMGSCNINLWYDSGIEAGSEWPEFIAEKVMYCQKFVLFISQAYLASQNCKRELNYAISRKKDILAVYLEDVTLSPGMEMQLGTYQAIFRKRFANDAAFVHSLAREPFFNSCKLAPGQTPTYTQSNSQQNQSQPGGYGYSQQNPRPNPGGYGYSQQNPRPNPGGYGYSQQNPGGYGYSQPNPGGTDIFGQPLPTKSKMLAGLLAIFFGWIGLHKFYLRQKTLGIAYLLFFWTGVPFFLGLYDAYRLFTQSNSQFAAQYKCRPG